MKTKHLVKELATKYGQSQAAVIDAAVTRWYALDKRQDQGAFQANKPNLVYDWAKEQGLLEQEQESFYVLLLDTKFRVIKSIELTRGILNGTLVHPREIFREACMVSAYAFLVMHNHPSGDPKPTPEDLETTRQLIRAGKMMQIELMDHVICGSSGLYSLREQESWLWQRGLLDD